MHVIINPVLRLLGAMALCLLSVSSLYAISDGKLLTLEDAVSAAINDDPWLDRSSLEESSLYQRAKAAKPLPDPSLKFGVLNVPTDTFDLDQEPMTQIKASVVMKIPRGDSRVLKSRQFSQQAAVQPVLRAARKSELIRNVSLLWLEGWFAQQSRQLLIDSRFLFDELRTNTTSNYNSGIGTARQQDLILADLELTRLDEKILKFEQQYFSAGESLSQWLVPDGSQFHFAEIFDVMTRTLSADDTGISVDGHPSLMAIKQQQTIADTRLDLERQGSKSDWVVEVGYAHRLDAQNGSDRADFVSLGFSASLPSFNRNRTDNLITAAREDRQMLESDYELKKREFLSGLRKALITRESINKRLQLYTKTLIQQLEFRTEAVTNAYTSDSTRFEEVMRAQQKEIDARLEVIALQFQKSTAEILINYYLTSLDDQGNKL